MLKKLGMLVFPRHVRHQHPDPDSMLLQLPVEILGLIWQQLSPVDQAILPLACRTLHNLFEDWAGPFTYSRAQSLEFSITIARDLPGLWVCESCCNLHRIQRTDSPRSASRRHCDGFRLGCQHPGIGFRDVVHFSHRHVQLSIKYTRMLADGGNPGSSLTHSQTGKVALARKHRKYLERLLKPCHATFSPEPYRQLLKGRFSALPRIVGGRYLLQSVWRYERADLKDRIDRRYKRLSQEHLGALKVCGHELFHFAARRPQEVQRVTETMAERRRTARAEMDRLRHNPTTDWVPLSPGAAVACARDYMAFASLGGGRGVGPCSLRNAVDDALDRPGTEAVDSCCRCPVDFSVFSVWDRVEIRAWYDLGPEGPATDSAWAVHVYGGLHMTGPVLYHEPGSIREQYESVEGKR